MQVGGDMTVQYARYYVNLVLEEQGYLHDQPNLFKASVAAVP